MAVISTLIALFLPAVQRSRELARQITCENHLKQLGIAAQTHEAAQGRFPYTSTSFLNNALVARPAISPHCYLVMALDPPVFRRISFQDATGNVPNSPPSSAMNSALFRHTVSVFQCPSDSVPPGGNSYRANLGISPNNYSSFDVQARKGAFVHDEAVRASTFSDELSSTAFFSERVVGDASVTAYDPFRDRFEDPANGQYAADFVAHCRSYAVPAPAIHDSFSGHTWILGGWLHAWYNHILAPNSTTPDCASGVLAIMGGGPRAYTARSFHAGGVNVLFTDGAVKLKSNHINLAVWSALGTRNGHEPVVDP